MYWLGSVFIGSWKLNPRTEPNHIGFQFVRLLIRTIKLFFWFGLIWIVGSVGFFWSAYTPKKQCTIVTGRTEGKICKVSHLVLSQSLSRLVQGWARLWQSKTRHKPKKNLQWRLIHNQPLKLPPYQIKPPKSTHKVL
jgi:hypothetical protein